MRSLRGDGMKLREFLENHNDIRVKEYERFGDNLIFVGGFYWADNRIIPLDGGFYPLNMGSGEYAITSPLYKKYTLHLPTGDLVVTFEPLSFSSSASNRTMNLCVTAGDIFDYFRFVQKNNAN